MYIILIEGLGGDAVFAFLASCDGARFTPLSDDHGHGKHWRTLHLLQGEMSGFVMGTSSMTESFFFDRQSRLPQWKFKLLKYWPMPSP